MQTSRGKRKAPVPYLECGPLALEPGGQPLEVGHLSQVVLVQVLPQVARLNKGLHQVEPLIDLVRLQSFSNCF